LASATHTMGARNSKSGATQGRKVVHLLRPTVDRTVVMRPTGVAHRSSIAALLPATLAVVKQAHSADTLQTLSRVETVRQFTMPSKAQPHAGIWPGPPWKVYKKCYNPVFWQQVSHWADSYVWSSEVVPITQAQPRDIAQYISAWNPHTAVVTECYANGVLTTYEQNPSPVAVGKYHPHSKSFGAVRIYRLESSSLRLHSQMPQLSVLGLHSGQLNVLAGVCAITGLLAVASLIVKRQRSVARSAPPTIEEEALLCPEMLNPEVLEVATE